MKLYLQARALRSWQAHEAAFEAGQVYRIRDFLAAILARGGYVEILGEVEVTELVQCGQGELW